MGAAAQAHEVVRNEAVEYPAEKPLYVEVERILQTEDRVCRDTSAGTIAAISVSRFVDAATSR